jgi:hypothetical protein
MGNIRKDSVLMSKCASKDRPASGCVACRQEYLTLPECIIFECRIYMNGFDILEAEEGRIIWLLRGECITMYVCMYVCMYKG